MAKQLFQTPRHAAGKLHTTPKALELFYMELTRIVIPSKRVTRLFSIESVNAFAVYLKSTGEMADFLAARDAWCHLSHDSELGKCLSSEEHDAKEWAASDS